jgi:hypothetical protein
MSRKQSEVSEHRTYKIDKQQCWTNSGAETICHVNNDTTYDHTSNIVQKQVNSDATYDHTSNIVQKHINNDTTYDHTF